MDANSLSRECPALPSTRSRPTEASGAGPGLHRAFLLSLPANGCIQSAWPLSGPNTACEENFEPLRQLEGERDWDHPPSLASQGTGYGKTRPATDASAQSSGVQFLPGTLPSLYCITCMYPADSASSSSSDPRSICDDVIRP